MEAKQTRRERKKEETKLRILNTALELFRRQGFAATTIDQITEAADVGKGTFYNYSGTKEAVIGFYIASETAKSRELLRPVIHQLPDTKSRLLTVMQSWTSFVRENREYVRVQMAEIFKLYLTMGVEEPDEFRFHYFLAEIINWGQSQGDVRKDISAEDMGRYLELLFFGPGSWYCAVSEEYPLEEKLSEAISLFLEGAGHD